MDSRRISSIEYPIKISKLIIDPIETPMYVCILLYISDDIDFSNNLYPD